MAMALMLPSFTSAARKSRTRHFQRSSLGSAIVAEERVAAHDLLGRNRSTLPIRHHRSVDQIIQVIGALLILVAFGAAQFGWMRLDSRLYLTLNLLGGAVLAWLAWDDRQWGFLLLESVWTLVSGWGLANVLRGRPTAVAH
jgi:hypothetical protein